MLRDQTQIGKYVWVIIPHITVANAISATNVRWSSFGCVYGVCRAELANRIDELVHLIGLEDRSNDQ